MNATALVLHSGGMDSTVALLLAREAGLRVISLGFDYGQRHAVELEYAARLCERFDVPRRIITVRWDQPELSIRRPASLEDIGRSLSPAFLPGRNLVFLSLAAAEAAGVGATELWAGMNAVDFSGYPDCRPAFVEAFRACLGEALIEAPAVVTPLIDMTKPQIAAEAMRLGIGRNDTWSCYAPMGEGSSAVPCKACDACLLHDYAWDSMEAAPAHS
jgi:7-cyano-7-deazaguanine synthase